MLIGIVGKPNVGKSTFFRSATLADALIANYPFATIKPNSGIGFVRIRCADSDFHTQCHPRSGYCIGHHRFLPVQIIDVAGLVPGAHLGSGMGNQFLDDLRQADALIHVIDISGSTNEKGEITEPGSCDPALDVKFLEEELDQWYLSILKKGWERFTRTLIAEKSAVHLALAKQLSGLGVTQSLCEQEIDRLGLDPVRPQQWTDDDLLKLSCTFRAATKPLVIAANKIDLPGAASNLQRLQKEFPSYRFIPCAADFELALREAHKSGLISYLPGSSSFDITANQKLSEPQRQGLHHIKDGVLSGYGHTGVQQAINCAVLDLLGYIAVFPGGVARLEDKDGNVLPDCFLMKPASTALNFAYKLHTDLGKNFICAKDVRTKKTLGKDYLLHHRDVIEIVAGR